MYCRRRGKCKQTKKGLKEVRSKISILLETTGGILFSLEGFEKMIFTILNFTQVDLHSTGGIQMFFLGGYNSTGGIQIFFLGVYNFTGGIPISFLGGYNSSSGFMITLERFLNPSSGITNP